MYSIIQYNKKSFKGDSDGYHYKFRLTKDGDCYVYPLRFVGRLPYCFNLIGLL